MTYQDLINFAQLAQHWLNTKPADTKLVYAVNKVLKRAKPLLESYNEQVQDLEIEHAAETHSADERAGKNPPGILLREANGQLSYTKDGLQKRNTAIRVLAKSDVTIEPHLVPRVPVDLPAGLVDAFTGFVFAPQEDVEPQDDAPARATVN